MSESLPPSRISNSVSSRTLEIAHVLFTDIVGYSKLLMDEQEELLMQLQDAVRHTAEFARAEASENLIRLPTGDGMALVFFQDAEAPVRCALGLTRLLRSHPELKLRMGIHSGPVYRVADINANRNVAGGGINIAQRVMDCGDAGHILVSRELAEVLGQLSGWRPMLHDLGEVEVKHGVRIHIYNLFTYDVGNAELPKKFPAPNLAVPPTNSHTKVKKRYLPITAGTAVLALVLISAWFLVTRKAHALSPSDTVVLADFNNMTGNPVFDDTLKQALSVALGQSPFLNILSNQKVRETLKLLGHRPDESLSLRVAREVCLQTGSAAVFEGSIGSLGTEYVIGLKAVNCRTGAIMAQEEAHTPEKEELLAALDQASVRLRESVGESLNTIKRYSTPLDRATTTSLDALKAYSEGEKAALSGDDTASITYYGNAIDLDPHFANAYLSLGLAYSKPEDVGVSKQFLSQAYHLREQATKEEEFRIESTYYRLATRDIDRAKEVLREWARVYPRHSTPRFDLAFLDYSVGHYEQAIKDVAEGTQPSTDQTPDDGDLVGYYVAANHRDDARNTYNQAVARKAETTSLHANKYALAFLEDDHAEMDRQVSWAANQTDAEDALQSYASDTEAYYGRNAKARELSRNAIDSAIRDGKKEKAALWQMNVAFREAELGYVAESDLQAWEALSLDYEHDSQIVGALALARASDSDRAETIANNLAELYKQDTFVNHYWLPSIKATIEIDRGNPKRAIEILQLAAPYELATPENVPTVGTTLYPVYIRALAHLALHQGKEAAAEFQKIIDNRTVVQNFVTGALAHLGLGRAYALQGDTVKARAAYQDFLALWKNADPDIPVLKEAKLEYAKLI
jgi:class 3 adenylate cyclase